MRTVFVPPNYLTLRTDASEAQNLLLNASTEILWSVSTPVSSSMRTFLSMLPPPLSLLALSPESFSDESDERPESPEPESYIICSFYPLWLGAIRCLSPELKINTIAYMCIRSNYQTFKEFVTNQLWHTFGLDIQPWIGSLKLHFLHHYTKKCLNSDHAN